MTGRGRRGMERMALPRFSRVVSSCAGAAGADTTRQDECARRGASVATRRAPFGAQNRYEWARLMKKPWPLRFVQVRPARRDAHVIPSPRHDDPEPNTGAVFVKRNGPGPPAE